MINVGKITAEAELAEILAGCGFTSEAPALSPSWNDLQRHVHLALARHLTGETYKNLIVALQGGALHVYWWITLVCELKGVVTAEQLAERIELCASPDRAPGDPAQCICLERPLPFYHYGQEKFIGVDETNGRFGRVTVKQCLHCGQTWLHYFVEYEAFSRSGRFFMGLITPDLAGTITPEAAVGYLENLDWHLYSGSYFGKAGRSTVKRIDVDG